MTEQSTQPNLAANDDQISSVPMGQDDDRAVAGQGVIVINGQVRGATTPALAALFVALHASEQELVIDLSAVTALEEIGGTILMMAHRRLASQGRRLVLASPTPSVRRVLDSMGLNNMVAVADEPSPAQKRPIATKFDVLRRRPTAQAGPIGVDQ